MNHNIGRFGTAIPLLFLVVALGSCGQPKEQESDPATPEAELYTCSMHPEVVSEEPGRCPECNMELVSAEEPRHEDQDSTLSAGDKIQKARQLLAEAKSELDYACCIETPCDRCALDHQSCNCGNDLKEGKGICSDCYAGWQTGDGAIEGIERKDIKPAFHSHSH